MGEESLTQAIHYAVKCDSSGSGVSRRRMTFRPYSIPQPINVTSAQPSVSSGNSETEQSSSGAAHISNLGKTTRKWGMWNNLEINAFYDGIKQFGKDFDQVAKLMAKKKMNKDKDQIRNYYYNSFKLLRSTAQFEDEIINEFPRDARELFIVINGFEWKKRTEDMKIDPAKLRQLVLEGSTSVRLKKKKQNLIVRTPFCPSLQKFFPSRKTEERLPSHVVIWLTPKTHADRYFVEMCGQNPLLRIRVSVGERIARIFLLLKTKWVLRIAKQDIFQQEGISSDVQELDLALYPDKTTKVESILLKYVKDTPSSLISLNRLKKERSLSFTEKCDDPGILEGALCSNSLPYPSDKTAEPIVEDSTHLLTDAFTLSALRLRSGLTEKIAGNATITELFYLCGMERDIRLQYSTNSIKRSTVEPWNIFVSLINRNYGENLCKALSEPDESESSHNFSVTEEGTRKRRASSSVHSESLKQLSLISEKQISSTDHIASNNPAVVVHDHVVESENNAFKLQFESMQQSRKRGRSLVQRGAPSKVSSQSMQIGTFMTTIKPTASSVSGTNCYFVSAQDLANAQQKNNGQFIDFSSIASAKGSSGEVLNMLNHSQDDAPNATPNTHFAAEVLTSMSLQNDEAANDSFFSQFESGIVITGGTDGNAFSSRMTDMDSTQKTLTELSAVEFSGNTTQVDLTPVKNTSNLPEDVRHSFEMMMQQNSVDYCRNFEQLITSIETPKKFS